MKLVEIMNLYDLHDDPEKLQGGKNMKDALDSVVTLYLDRQAGPFILFEIPSYERMELSKEVNLPDRTRIYNFGNPYLNSFNQFDEYLHETVKRFIDYYSPPNKKAELLNGTKVKQFFEYVHGNRLINTLLLWEHYRQGAYDSDIFGLTACNHKAKQLIQFT